MTYFKEEGTIDARIGEIAAMVTAAQAVANLERKNAAPERTAFDE